MKCYRALILVGIYMLFVTACAVQKPVIVLPPEPDLPGVVWTPDNGKLCLTPKQAVNLRQREELRDSYEAAMRALLLQLGATDASR